MKTNGISASPKAMNGPAGGASALSDAMATSPASTAQYEGTNRSVAIVIARHFLRGESGPTPAGEDDRRRITPAQPLTAPAVSPRTKYFWSVKNTMSGRLIEMNAAAVSRCQFSPRDPTRLESAIVSTLFSWVPPRNT
jgi:hypothetical protein